MSRKRVVKDSEIYLGAAKRMAAQQYGNMICISGRPGTALAIHHSIENNDIYATDSQRHEFLYEYFGPQESGNQWTDEDGILALLFMSAIAKSEGK